VLVALGVTLTIATRLGSAEHGGPIDCLRTLLLLGFAAAVAPAAAYSLGFYVPPLAGVITHYLEQYHL
jgi:hypothetical protein